MKLNLKEVLSKIKLLLTDEVIEVILEKQTLVDDQTVLEAESFEQGKEVFIVTETENVPLPIGSYELKDGRVLVVEEDGMIASIEAGAPETDEEPPMTEPEMVEEEVEEEVEIDDVIAGLQAQIDELKASLNLSVITVSEKQTEIDDLNVKLSELPATTKLGRVNEIVETITTKKTNNKPATKFATILNHINK